MALVPSRDTVAPIAPAAVMPGRGRIGWMFLLAAVLAFLLLLIPFRTFESFDRDLVVWGTALVLGALVAAAYLSARQHGENPWIDPLFLMAGFFGYKYGFGVIAVNYWSTLSWEETPGVRSLFERWGIWENLPVACHLFLLAGLGLYLGTALPAGRVAEWLPALRWRIDERRLRLNLYLYTPLAMLVFVSGRSFLPVVIRDTVLLFGWVSWVMLIIAAVRWFGRSSVDRAAWFGIVAMISVGHLLLGLEIGMRGAFVYPLLLVGAGYALSRGRLPWIRVGLVGALLLVLIIPWLSFYKLQSPQSSIPDRIRSASGEMSETTMGGKLDRGVEAVVGRSVGVVGMTAVFIQDVPDLEPFEYGRTFLIQAAHVIPRVLWPDKPNMSEQLNVYSRRAGLIDEEDDVTSAVFDAVSEYYVNFGLMGVFFLSLLHGYYFRVLHHWLVQRSLFIVGAPMFLVFVLINFDFFGIVQIVLAHTRQIPAWALALYFLSRDTRAVPSEAP
jgi:hypothetical protein